DVDDADNGVTGDETLKVTLTAANGTVTLGGTAGLGFTTGSGFNDPVVTFTGSITNINNALAGLSFQPNPNFNGAASLTITTNDQGNFGTGGPLSSTNVVAISVNAVNDAPINTLPAAQSTNEETALVLSSALGRRISIGDVDDA